MIVTANQTIDNYWIRANPNHGKTGTALGLNSAILRYIGAKNREPRITQDKSTNPLVQGKLVPLEKPGVTGNDSTKCRDCADYNLNLEFTYNGTFANGAFTVNGAGKCSSVYVFSQNTALLKPTL